MSDEDFDDDSEEALQRKRAREAKELEAIKKGLEPIAKALGLCIAVAYDPYAQGWTITAAAPVNGRLTIDEEVFLCPPDHRAELVRREMEHVQLRLFDELREHMAKHDRDKRIAKLSDEDRNTLHEMLREAERALLAPYYGSEATFKNVTDRLNKFSDLVRRLAR